MLILENENQATKYKRQALELEKISNREFKKQDLTSFNYYSECLDLERFQVLAKENETLDDVVYRYLKTNAPEVLEIVFKLNPQHLKKHYLKEGELVCLYIVEQTQTTEHRLW